MPTPLFIVTRRFETNPKISMKFFVLMLLICGLVVGCESYQEQAARRTAQLRQLYPPGTSREEVQRKWGQINPDFSASRPDAGWRAYTNKYIAEKLQNDEKATGKTIGSVDRYWGPDGFLSLCYCWYFYDPSNRIVDVEWQYKSD